MKKIRDIMNLELIFEKAEKQIDKRPKKKKSKNFLQFLRPLYSICG